MPKLSMKYHKINSLFKRDANNRFIIGEWSTPELEYLHDKEWVFTEKVDGTNIRVMWNGKEAIFAGRSDDTQLFVPLIYKLDSLFKTMEARQKLAEVFLPNTNDEVSVVLYGEGYGAKIQKGGGNYISNGVDFVLFDVVVGNMYLQRPDVLDVGAKLGIKVVPEIGQGTLEDAIEMTKKGFKSQWGDFVAEGIVARPKVELFTRRGDRIITKVKYRDFN